MRSYSMNSLLIVCVCVIPLCLLLSQRIHHLKYRHILSQLVHQTDLNNNNISAKWIDQFVRYIYYNFDYFYEDYIANESVTFNNVQDCTVFAKQPLMQNINQLFQQCLVIQQNLNEIEMPDSQYSVEFLGDKNRKLFMNYYLMDIMEKYLNEIKIKDSNHIKLIYSYINFLIDVKQIPQKVSFELLKMKNSNLKNSNQNMNGHTQIDQQNTQQKKNQISSLISCLLYEQMKERSEEKFELYYSKDEFQNQRLSLNLVIEFDDLLNLSSTYLQDIVYEQEYKLVQRIRSR